MTLRARLSLLVALAVAVAVAAVAGAAYVSASREARGEIDAFLNQRAAALTALGAGGNRFPASREMGMGSVGVFDVFGPDSAFQAFDQSGEVVAYLRGGPALPISADDLAVAGVRRSLHAPRCMGRRCPLPHDHRSLRRSIRHPDCP